jgi:hypothetical protein
MFDEEPSGIPDSTRDFKIINELRRGIIYRGGKELDDYMSGYAYGLVFSALILAFLFILGTIKGHLGQ